MNAGSKKSNRFHQDALNVVTRGTAEMSVEAINSYKILN